jgi:hypothetical protein
VSSVAPLIPAWDEGYSGGNVGGLLEAMLRPTKGFGKFLTVLLSLSVAGNIAATFYSVSLNMQILLPPLVIVPRYIFSIVATAMYVDFQVWYSLHPSQLLAFPTAYCPCLLLEPLASMIPSPIFWDSSATGPLRSPPSFSWNTLSLGRTMPTLTTYGFGTLPVVYRQEYQLSELAYYHLDS